MSSRKPALRPTALDRHARAAGHSVMTSALTFRVTVLAAVLVASASVGHAAANPQAPAARRLQAFFTAHCVSCHGEKDPKGELTLSRIDDAKWSDFKFALDVLGQLEERVMPPDDAKKKLPDADRAKAIEILASRLGSLKPEHGGDVLIRLNKTEYENTINDVFGVNLQLADLLPPDPDPEEGFANVGQRLFISPGSVERYMNLGVNLSQRLIRSRPTPINTTFNAGHSAILPKVKANTDVKKLLTQLAGFKGQPVSYVIDFDV
ncbi:MAG: DUF1587 domain-containing protein, partial [Planctomycetales bacterium]